MSDDVSDLISKVKDITSEERDTLLNDMLGY